MEWALLEPIILSQKGPGWPRTVNLRRMIDALLYVDRSGYHWHLIPLNFPPSGIVRYSFNKWNADGTLLEIHDTLRRKLREQQERTSNRPASEETPGGFGHVPITPHVCRSAISAASVCAVVGPHAELKPCAISTKPPDEHFPFNRVFGAR